MSIFGRNISKSTQIVVQKSYSGILLVLDSVNNIFSEESINDIEDDIRLLVYKYIELDDLENLFDDIKYILRKQIREKSVAKLREKMRKKK